MLHHPPRFAWLASVPISRRVPYAAEAVIANGCDPAERVVYVVLSGTVRLSLLAADGREQVLMYLPQGSLFGEQAALGQTALLSDLTAIADEDCAIGHLRTADIVAVLKTSSDPLRDLMRVTGEKTSFFLQATARAAFGSARARVASLLSALGSERKQVTISQERLARLCGTTRVTVAAQLHQLEEEGAISIGRSRIVIRDSGKLAAPHEHM
ncbi:MAG: Crp/Fnr family transcriptional regulator [Rhodospirillaceae bacterium]|nr:Crp/Fnr family transcriptional regulator [Rhodospirillaceae bacterium]